jgi:hypothetical protein
MMKAEIELEPGGDCVELVFEYEHYHDVAHGLNDKFYFEPDYMTRTDPRTGEPMLPERATNLEITDHIADQLIAAVRSSWDE